MAMFETPVICKKCGIVHPIGWTKYLTKKPNVRFLDDAKGPDEFGLYWAYMPKPNGCDNCHDEEYRLQYYVSNDAKTKDLILRYEAGLE